MPADREQLIVAQTCQARTGVFTVLDFVSSFSFFAENYNSELFSCGHLGITVLFELLARKNHWQDTHLFIRSRNGYKGIQRSVWLQPHTGN